jgi:hypothetical protein
MTEEHLKQKMQEARRIYTARFQQNPDGTFVGYFGVIGDEIPCWLVVDPENTNTINLSFEEPKS